MKELRIQSQGDPIRAFFARTNAGLKSARARGRKGGRPKGMTPAAIEKATIAEALYKNGSIPVKKIAEQLGISKTTLYLYLRYRL
jgi:DNA invertase Pin-like site-specific DNA recombinase